MELRRPESNSSKKTASNRSLSILEAGRNLCEDHIPFLNRSVTVMNFSCRPSSARLKLTELSNGFHWKKCHLLV